MTILVLLFFGLGAVFAAAGLAGMLLFPDFYTRLQASSVCSTTAVFSIFIGCMLYEGFSNMTGRILVISLFFLVSSPVSTHILARFAWEQGLLPWKKPRDASAGEDTPRDGEEGRT